MKNRKFKTVSVVDFFEFKGFRFTVFYCENNHLAVSECRTSVYYILFGGPYTPEKKKALIDCRSKSDRARLAAFNAIEDVEFNVFRDNVLKIRGELRKKKVRCKR